MAVIPADRSPRWSLPAMSCTMLSPAVQVAPGRSAWISLNDTEKNQNLPFSFMDAYRRKMAKYGTWPSSRTCSHQVSRNRNGNTPHGRTHHFSGPVEPGCLARLTLAEDTDGSHNGSAITFTWGVDTLWLYIFPGADIRTCSPCIAVMMITESIPAKTPIPCSWISCNRSAGEAISSW